jgi:hypothetical protein
VLRHSQSDEGNPDVTEWEQDGDNLAFFRAALGELAAVPEHGRAVIGLVGHTDLPGVLLRRAQSILRWDRRPSLWSHAFLVVEPLADDVGAVGIREVPLHSRTGAFPEPNDNAITAATLGHYASVKRDPNVALLSVRMSDEEATSVIERATTSPNLERLRYDLFETLGFWQSYLWTRGTGNPLESGVPMAASSMVEYCFEAIGHDLTPGANDRNSAPEHLWNGARWWTKEFGAFDRPMIGRYLIRDPGCTGLGAGEL